MRLICPNCDAEYEVDGSLFPPEGREVQCSNCSNTWFVNAPGQAPAAAGDPQTPPELAPKPDADAKDQTPDEAVSKAEDPSEASDSAASRIETDPKTLDILHAEVEREKRARAEETGGLETQADLGLDDTQNATAPKTTEAEPDFEPTEAALAPAPRRPDGNKRELLPDIEEINSTLAEAPDPEFDENGDVVVSEASRRSSFRLGFGLALLVVAGLLVVYAYAPELAARFPQAAEPLQSYVGIVDNLRLTLADATEALAEKIDALTEQVGNSS